MTLGKFLALYVKDERVMILHNNGDGSFKCLGTAMYYNYGVDMFTGHLYKFMGCEVKRVLVIDEQTLGIEVE